MDVFINKGITADVEVFLLGQNETPSVYVNAESLDRAPVLIPQKDENSPAFLFARVNCAPEALRRLAGECARIVIKQKVYSCILHLERYKETDAEAALEGFLLGLYSFQRYKTVKDGIDTCDVRLSPEPDSFDWVPKIKNRVEAVNFARELTGLAPSELYPSAFLELVRLRFMNTPVEIECYQGKQLESMGFTGLLSVGRGSRNLPAMCLLRYITDPKLPLTVLIGKGVTFDMGGMSIKLGKDISDARMDMGGAAAVCGAFDILRHGGKPKNVIGLLLLAENLPDANALIPSDVLRLSNNTTVQIVNTDAEGRLILADGILYAKELCANRIIDIATLTGSVGVALGLGIAGVMGDDGLCGELCAIGGKNGDLLWQLPLVDDYASELRSDYADIKNSCETPYGDCIIAALFLKHFTGGTSWAHIDMANTVQSKRSSGYHNVGPTGYGVRLLADFLEEADF